MHVCRIFCNWTTGVVILNDHFAHTNMPTYVYVGNRWKKVDVWFTRNEFMLMPRWSTFFIGSLTALRTFMCVGLRFVSRTVLLVGLSFPNWALYFTYTSLLLSGYLSYMNANKNATIESKHKTWAQIGAWKCHFPASSRIDKPTDGHVGS